MNVDDDASSDDQTDSDGQNDAEKGKNLHKEGTALNKKEHKKLVKEANREKRQNKTPKHVKKRKEKLAKTKRGRNN